MTYIAPAAMSAGASAGGRGLRSSPWIVLESYGPSRCCRVRGGTYGASVALRSHRFSTGRLCAGFCAYGTPVFGGNSCSGRGGFGSRMMCRRRLRDWVDAAVWRRLHEVPLAEFSSVALDSRRPGLCTDCGYGFDAHRDQSEAAEYVPGITRRNPRQSNGLHVYRGFVDPRTGLRLQHLPVRCGAICLAGCRAIRDLCEKRETERREGWGEEGQGGGVRPARSNGHRGKGSNGCPGGRVSPDAPQRRAGKEGLRWGAGSLRGPAPPPNG